MFVSNLTPSQDLQSDRAEKWIVTTFWFCYFCHQSEKKKHGGRIGLWVCCVDFFMSLFFFLMLVHYVECLCSELKIRILNLTGVINSDAESVSARHLLLYEHCQHGADEVQWGLNLKGKQYRLKRSNLSESDVEDKVDLFLLVHFKIIENKFEKSWN